MTKRSGAFVPVIPLDRRGARPLHAQIYRALRDGISRGELRAGQRLPSSRVMCSELAVSRITVLEAYAQLRAEGYLAPQRGSGTFVSRSMPEHLTQVNPAQPASPPPPVMSNATPVTRAHATAAAGPRPISRRALLVPPEQAPPWRAGLGAFAVHQPAFDEFPFSTWSRLVNQHARNPNAHAIHCIDPMGSRRFREAICGYLRTARAVQATPDQIMIVSGSQQALQIAAAVLLDPGASVWMEEPGYRLARNVFLAAGCRLVPVPVDAEGLNVTAGIKRAPHAAAVYVTPSHQYPLGSTMSAARRLQLLNWAQRSGSWIIEDDYDSEYRFESAPISSLQGLDTNSRVLYIGTFSKVLFASLRMGYMVIPQDLVERFTAIRYAMDIFPPYLYQEVIADFIQAGHFSRHIRRMRLLYSQRRKTLVDLLRTHLGAVLEFHGSEAGMHLAVTFRPASDRDDSALAVRAAALGLWLWPLSGSYITRDLRHGFILGYGNVAPQTMPKAVAKLTSLLTRAGANSETPAASAPSPPWTAG